MTSEQYRAIRARLELSQSELADRLGLTFNTISRRELRQLPITREAELAIKWIEQEAVRDGRKKSLP